MKRYILIGVGAIVALAFPAFHAGSPIDVSGIAFMLIASLICTIPLGLYVRAILRSERSTSPADRLGQDPRQAMAEESQKETGSL